MAVTSKDVARLAGVSVATVSRVFSNENVVKPASRERVLSAAQQLNYTPNKVARSLKSSKSHTVGLVVSNIYNFHYLRVAAIIARELEQHGYNMLLSFYTKYDEDEVNMLRSLLSAQVDAVAFTPIVAKKEVSQLFANSDVYPLQIHSEVYSHIDSIHNDDLSAMKFLTQYLIDRGHRDIMLISPDEKRTEGVFSTMEKNGIPVTENTFLHTMDMAPNAEEMEKAVLEAKPTAIIAVAQEAKDTLLGILKKNKLKIPRDISLIGYDDDELSEYLGITTMGHDIEYIGKSISQILLDHLLGREAAKETGLPRHLLMDTLFIERSSVRDIRGETGTS